MIDRDDEGRLVFHCDTCPDAIDTEAHNIVSALRSLRSEGWQVVRIGSGVSAQYLHRCPDCQAQYRGVAEL